MRLFTSLMVLIAGVVFVIFGISVSQSASAGLAETTSGAPSAKSLLFIITGVLCLIYGGVGTIFNRK